MKLQLTALIFCIVASLGTCAYSQDTTVKPESVKSKKGGSYILKGTSFLLPDDLTLKDDGKADGILLAFSTDYHYGIFVALVPKDVRPVAASADAYEKGLKLFYNESNMYQWKQSRLVTHGNLSKYQVNSAALQGYNGKNRALVHIYHIKYKDREFLAGYMGLDEKDAKTSFETGYDMGSAPGCQAVVEIISSVTKEEFSIDEDPCSDDRPQGRPSGN